MSMTTTHRLPRDAVPGVGPARSRGAKRCRPPLKRRPGVGLRRRASRGWARGGQVAQSAVKVILLLAILIIVNWWVQVLRKPSELFFPVSDALFKTPQQTWKDYAPLFQKYSTPTMTAPFLAALAQQEGAGNPIARTYWRWAWDYRPFEIYRPASSSVGMFQMTDGNFAEAKQWCIHDHAVVRSGAWSDWHSCWFNGAYFRVIPGHAIELTAAYLDVSTAAILARHGITSASLRQRQHLAATTHLCGAGVGDRYARRGFRFLVGERCGAHDPRAYLNAVDRYEKTFTTLAPN